MIPSSGVHVLAHPIIQQKLLDVRDRQADREAFRRGLSDLSAMIVYELARDLPVETAEVETPLGTAAASVPADVTLVPILRAGLAMLDGALRMLPRARVGHIGVYRDETSLEPVVYYNKLPPDVAATEVIVVEPLLATGRSVSAAVSAIKHVGASRIRLAGIVAAPEGIRRLHEDHPDVPVYVAAVDETVDRSGHIVPGLGDAGERLFGTR